MYQWLHYQIIDLICNLFDSHKDIRTYFVKGLFVLCYKDIYEISFKKVDEYLRRSNNVTDHNLKYWEQKLLPGIPEAIRLLIGYQPRKENTEIEVVVTAP